MSFQRVLASSIFCLLACQFLVLCQGFSQPSLKRCVAGARQSNSGLRLFPSKLQKKAASKTVSGYVNGSPTKSATSNCRIPSSELSILNEGFGIGQEPQFPYTIDLLPKNNDDEAVTNQSTKMIVRHLEEEDIIRILPEVVREFGSLMQHANSKDPGDKVATEVENYLFSMTVLIGLTQRVKRRIKGYLEGTSNFPDHNVICIVEQIPIINSDSTQPVSYNEQIVGIGEISWQPPNPNRNAPPFVLPFFAKQILAKFNPGLDENGQVLDAPRGYISNVLVYKNRRGLGYGQLLMAALEGIAKSWQCEDVRLHVDADEKTGKVAQSLYRKLGYVGVPDRGTTNKESKGYRVGFEWMGPHMANQGLYMVDGLPLLYMRKSLEANEKQ